MIWKRQQKSRLPDERKATSINTYSQSITQFRRKINMEYSIKLDQQDICSAKSETVVTLFMALKDICLASASFKQESLEQMESGVLNARKKAIETSKQSKTTNSPTKTENAPENGSEEVSEAVKEEPKTAPASETKKEEPKEETKVATGDKPIDTDTMKKRLMEIKESDKDKWAGIKALIRDYSENTDKPTISGIPEAKRKEFMEKVEAL